MNSPLERMIFELLNKGYSDVQVEEAVISRLLSLGYKCTGNTWLVIRAKIHNFREVA